MPLEPQVNYPVEPILDFELPDLRGPVHARSSRLSFIPHRVGELLNGMTAVIDIIKAIHGDPLTIPDNLKGPGHEEEIGEEIARRFDPWSDFVKARIYATKRKADLEKVGFWSSLALGTGYLEFYLAGIAQIVGGIAEGTLLDRTFVNVAEAFIAQDRVHDENRRINPHHWAEVFEEQLDEAVKKAGLEGYPEAAQKLRVQARTLIIQRHRAFNERFPNTGRGRRARRRALNDSLEFHNAQIKWDEYMRHLAKGGQPKGRRQNLRTEVIAKKHKVIAYHSELDQPRYVSLEELDREREVQARVAERLARQSDSRRRSWFR